MSAIWGIIKNNGALEAHTHGIKEIYHRKCILDQINEKSTARQLFGCGIQFITRESSLEQLPFYLEDKQLLFTSDCLLDNRGELLDALQIEDKNMPDGTILYHAYLKWGYDCLSHLHGLYSIAAYDIATDTLFLATDPTASRCLYYCKNTDGCMFSTLLEPILHIYPDIKKNELYLEDYLMAPGLRPNLSATETPYEGIYKIEAGTYVTISGRDLQIHRYWLPKTLPLHIKNEAQCKELFLSTFQNCVQRALRTSGEVGIALSSGFDSSSVAAVAARLLDQASKSLYSYTYVPYYANVSDEESPYYVINEQEAIQKTVAMHPNIKPKFLNTKGAPFYYSMDKILSIMEIPFKAFVNLPSLQELFEEAAKNQCKVFLTGQYGNATISYGNIDDILYERYSHHHYLSYLTTLNRYCKNAKESRKQALIGCHRYFQHTAKVLGSSSTAKWSAPDNVFLDKALVSNFPYEARYSNEKLPGENIALPKHLYEHYLYYTSALTYLGEYETKFGLANGLLIRDPTRDPDILSFCHTIPYKYFAYKGIPRWLVRECLKDEIPSEILTPYLRYGLQNADWAYRVELDWTNLCPLIKQSLASPSISKYMDSTAINSFLGTTRNSFGKDNYNQSTFIFILDILSRFLTKEI